MVGPCLETKNLCEQYTNMFSKNIFLIYKHNTVKMFPSCISFLKQLFILKENEKYYSEKLLKFLNKPVNQGAFHH